MKKSEIVVYPNPFSGHITIDLGYDPQDGTRLLLYGMDDRLLKAFELSHSKTILSLDEIHSGIYMIEIADDEAIIHRQKVIKVW